ncbi:TetR/AcrR family transcriptional regulator [Sphingomonas sp. H39-1-10]|uniref:TetR/AcrR family transcriptional regulator n=1 Tax=Sphingomonas TaxID=13687 RepID=UPI00088F8566|nr:MULTISPECIES: TetR/AcrR family transcriptional regulator [Sphingomonas]MDF0486731.1 TetR/AcrR family transcriptional regulator [Sphingomonas pollutisoli]SDA35385.1 transcriptional regulator, TetR family [Sphingomonas sp. NFR15]
MIERASGGRPTQAEAAARSEALLDTARALFSEKGYAGTTIDEVATVLRSSKHTIYRRYANKLVLLEAVVDRDVERFRAALIEAARTEADPLLKLRAVARTYFGFSASPGYATLYIAIALEAGRSDHLRAKLRLWSAAALEPMCDGIRAAAPEQGWDLDQAMNIAEILIDLLDGAASRSKWSDSPHWEPDAVFEMRWQLFLRAVHP